MRRFCPVAEPRFPKTRDFTRAFAAEYKAFMASNGVRGAQIAEKLERGEGYVSERVNGKRPLDTDDVDVLASFVEGWTGIDLMIELSRRARIAMHGPERAGELIEGRFGVGAAGEDEPTVKQPPAKERTAARKGTRKADEAPHAE
jgi:hypothetical protein